MSARRALAPAILSLIIGGFIANAQAQAPIARPGNDIGTGQSLPLSNNASNITANDSHSLIAPRLPTPAVSESAPPAMFLRAARDALAAGRTGEAQEALERAETRALSRPVRPSLARQPSGSPLVQQIAQARTALSGGDRQGAIRLIDSALGNPDATGQ